MSLPSSRSVWLFGVLMTITFWACLAGHGWQIYITHRDAYCSIKPLMMFLGWCCSTSLVGLGIYRTPWNRPMVYSRLPAMLTTTLSVVQSISPRLSPLSLSLAVLLNALVIFGIIATQQHDAFKRVLSRLYKLFIILTYTLGLGQQAISFARNGTGSTTLLYWGPLVVSSIIACIYFRLLRDRTLTAAFGVGSLLSLAIGIEVFVGIR